MSGYTGSADSSRPATVNPTFAAYQAAALTPSDNGTASNSQLVNGSDPRLGLRGGVALPKSATSSDGRLSPVASWPLGTLSVNFPDGYAADPARDRFIGGSTSTSGDNSWLVYALANGKVRLKAGSQNSSEVTVPSGTRWLHLVYDRVANTISLYCDSSATALVSIARTPTTPLDNCVAPVGGWGGQDWPYAGRLGAVVALNFAATQADRIAAMRGEYPQAWLGGSPAASAWAGAWADQNWTSGGGTVTANSAGALVASCPAATALYALKAESLIPAGVPLLAPGRKLRIRYDLTLNSGVAPTLRFQQGTIDTTVTLQLVAGAGVVQEITVGVMMLAAGINVLLQAAGASSFSLANVSLEILGAQLIVGPSDWTRTRGVDMSGNCNDLIYGTGVVAVEPATKTRVISATAAGATVSAGAVASVGALTGATYRDTKALAALRQWDAVTANWRQARPANCAALLAAVTANGTPLVEATAITGNAVIAANAALNLTHNLS